MHEFPPITRLIFKKIFDLIYILTLILDLFFICTEYFCYYYASKQPIMKKFECFKLHGFDIHWWCIDMYMHVHVNFFYQNNRILERKQQAQEQSWP